MKFALCRNESPRLEHGIRNIISVPLLAASKGDPTEISLPSAHYAVLEGVLTHSKAINNGPVNSLIRLSVASGDAGEGPVVKKINIMKK